MQKQGKIAGKVLEQKNETIDLKDRMIVDLLQKTRALERELEEATRTLPVSEKTEGAAEEKGYRRGIENVIEDVVSLVSKYEKDSGGTGPLAEKILGLLTDRYGLEVLEEQPTEIDPRIHQVIDVQGAKGGVERYVLVSKGYRIGARLLMPVKLRVIEGGKEPRCESPRRSELVLISGCWSGPKGAA